MTTRGTRVLLEAQRHHRHRLLGAVLTADARPSDDVVPRAGAVVGGAAVGVAMVVTVLVAGLLTPASAPGWSDGQLVVARGSGARYVSRDGELHAVPNAVSARLALRGRTGPGGGAGPEVRVVDDAAVAAAPHGRPLGIPGAPDDVPAVGQLLPTGWMACLERGHLRTTISSSVSREPAPAVVGEAVVVRASAVAAGSGSAGSGSAGSGSAGSVPPGPDELVVAGHRYALPVRGEQSVLRFLGLPAAPAPAPAGWADLFPPGRALGQQAFRFPASSPVGGPLPRGMVPDGLAGRISQVGQLLANTDHRGAMAVVLADGTVPVTPFAAAVYRATMPRPLNEPVLVGDADLASTPISPSRHVSPDDWPSMLPSAPDPGDTSVPCARLDAAADRAPRTELVRVDSSSAWVHRPAGSKDDDGPVVEVGHGALVRVVGASGTGSGTGSGTAGGGAERGRTLDTGVVVFVDGSALANPVASPPDEALSRLGYADAHILSVPSAWVALFPRGPVLAPLESR